MANRGKKIRVEIDTYEDVFIGFDEFTTQELINELRHRQTEGEDGLMREVHTKTPLIFRPGSLIEEMKYEVFLRYHESFNYDEVCKFFEGQYKNLEKDLLNRIDYLTWEIDDQKEEISKLEDKIEKLESPDNI